MCTHSNDDVIQKRSAQKSAEMAETDAQRGWGTQSGMLLSRTLMLQAWCHRTSTGEREERSGVDVMSHDVMMGTFGT